MSTEIRRFNSSCISSALQEGHLQEEVDPQAVEGQFKENLLRRFAQAPLIDQKWETILQQACANIGEKRSDPELFLQPERARPLSQELDRIVIGIEPNGFFPYGNAEMVEGESIRNSLKYLLHNIPASREVFNLSTLQMSLMPSEEQKREILAEIKQLFRALFAQHPQEDSVFKTLVGHLIIIYAQLNAAPDGDQIEIPQKIGEEWLLVNFQLTRLPLNPDWMGEVIDAYGLTPISHLDQASPLLVFKGSDSIFSALVDMMPGCAVGDFLYWLAKDRIGIWIEERRLQFPNRPVQIYGMSLGGALAYNAGADHYRNVEIHAYAPPGLFSSRFTLPEGQAIQGEILIDPQDLVSQLSHHPEGPQMVKVIRQGETSLALRHARLYGGEGTLLLRVNSAEENQRSIRTALTFLHQIVSIPLFPVLLIAMLVKALWFQFSLFWSAVLRRLTNVPVAHLFAQQ